MKKLLIFIFLFTSIVTNAQYFQTGQDPASLKWRQINTDNFQLIYPDYYENQAQILAQKLENIYEYGGYSLGYKPRKISVILHTQTVKSNGLVAYAPKRSEFYTTPHQRTYPEDWLEHLALHEFRHVVQIGKLNQELPAIIKLLLGEQGTALVFGAYLPWWFIEGDAVATETALGKYGRGRYPSFLVEHRAQVLERGIYSYDKAYLGSYRSYVPDHYQLGYYLVANSRQRYGRQIWEKAIKRVGEKPLSFTPFNKALKLETGMNKVQLYHSIFDSLAIVWKRQDENFTPAFSNTISKKGKIYTSYTYNHWLNENEIISYKTALNEIPAFVKLNKNGEEQKLHHPGFIFNESVSYRNEWVAWSEQVPDLRWSHSGCSKVYVLNVNNKKKLSFIPEFKTFAPAISPNMNDVVVVEADFSSNYYLSVYQISDGKLLHRIQTPGNNYFFSPEWLNEKELVALMLTEGGKQLAKFNLETGKHEILFDNHMGDIKDLRFANNKLYFISGFSGKNALYAFDLSDQKIYQLYEPRFGAEYPSVDSSGNVILSDYTGSGYRIIEIRDIQKKSVDNIEEEEYPLARFLASEEKGKPEFALKDQFYTSETYQKKAHLFNFHSWAPVFVDPYQYEFKPGVSMMSQNKLGTAETVLGYKWDTAEKAGKFYGRYTYKGWFPVLQFEANKGQRKSSYWLIKESMRNGEVVRRDTSLERFSWNETELSAQISLPLNLSQGIYHRLLQPGIKYELTVFNNNHSTPEQFSDGDYHSLSYQLTYQQFMRQSHQDVYPNFGFVLDGNYKHSPNGRKELGSLAAGQAIVYVPGLMANHGVKLYAGVQGKKAGEIFRFSDVVRFARGWGKIETNQLYTMGVDYRLPVINPDLSLGGLAYFRRINATVFADFSTLNANFNTNGQTHQTYTSHISSYGLELTGHLNFLRFYAPVKLGLRSSYLPEVDDFTFDLLFAFDFTSL